MSNTAKHNHHPMSPRHTRSLSLIAISAIALPLLGIAFAQSRSQPSEEAVHLQSIGRGLLMYAAANRGFFPADLGMLAKDLPAETFVSARRGTVLPDNVKSDPAALANWINTRGDFVYCVAPETKLSRMKDPTHMPVVVEKAYETNHGSTIAILFADGHVDEYAPTAAPGAITAPMPAPSTRPTAATQPG